VANLEGQDSATITLNPKMNMDKKVKSITLGGVSSNPVPGATIAYEVIYDNDGDGTAGSVVITDRLSSYVTYVANSASALPHDGSSTITFSNDGTDWTLNGNANPSQVRYIRWTFDTNVSSTDGDDRDTAQDDADDKDAGTVGYRVTIN